MTGSARVYLAVDNCFASKRWTRPAEWMEIVGSIGLSYVEASADTEADPLYCGEQYMADWADEVRQCERQTGVKVVNLYSGHGTYATLGLGHTDRRVRVRMLEDWIKPMIRAARRVKAGLGFYCHAFPDAVLQEPAAFNRYAGELCDQLGEVAQYAAQQDDTMVSLEQMYTPHQVPWTIGGTRDLLTKVRKSSGCPLYVTIDTGHQGAQRRYLRPSAADIRRTAEELSRDRADPQIWLGPRSAFDVFRGAVSGRTSISEAQMRLLLDTMDRYPYLFSAPEDADTYLWIESLGCYSPIVHLQQVVGPNSAHLPFTEDTNRRGLIRGAQLLKSLAASYAAPASEELPQRTETIYLTLEVFASAAETPHEILEKLAESVAYWRRFVPQDGTKLSQLVDGLEG